MIPRTTQAMGSVEWLLLVALSILWGGSFFFGKVALAELPPLTVVMCRVGLAALALGAAMVAGGLRLPRAPRIWAAFVAMGVLNNLIPFSLIFWGQTRIGSGLASILNATTPLFSVLLAWGIGAEALTPNRLGGVLAGIAGVALMIGPAAWDGLGLDVAAQLAVLAAAFSYACAGLFGRRFRGLPPIVTAWGQLTATSLMALPAALLIDRPYLLAPPSLTCLAAIAGLALLSTALAYVIYFRILAAAGATNLLLVTFLIPVSALLLGTCILGERLGGRHYLGMAFIGLGLAAIDGRPLRALRGRLGRRRRAAGQAKLGAGTTEA